MSSDIRAGRAFVELFVKNASMTKGLRDARRQLRNFGRSATIAGKQIALGGAAMLAPFVQGVRTLVGFSDSMLTVKAVTGATAAEFAKLSEQAKELGRTTSYTAQQVADGMAELGRAGFNTGEILEATDDILALARATGTDLAEAAGIAGPTLRSFGLDASEMGRVTDVMVATVNNSAQTLTDFGEAMKLAAPIADEFGLSLEETSKAIGVMANFGIKGSMAGTGMRQILLQLADPKIRARLQGMGVSLDDFGTTMLDIGRISEDLPGPERLALLKELFGQRAAGVGAKLGKEAFEKLTQEINNSEGAAKKAAEEMDSGIGGMFRDLMSAVEGAFIAISEAIQPALTAIADFATKASGAFTAIVKKHPGVVNALAAIGFGVAAVGSALFAMGLASKAAAFAITGYTAALKIAKVAQIAFAATNPFIAIVAAIGIAIAGVYALWDWWQGKKAESGLVGLNPEVVKRQAAERAARAAAGKAGDTGGTAGFGDPNKAPEISDAAKSMNERLADELSDYRISLIEDETERTIAAINKRYDKEAERAKELGADISLVEKARRAALDEIDQGVSIDKLRDIGRQAKEDRDIKESAQEATQRMEDDTKRLEIETNTKGDLARQKALIEHDRTIAMREAGGGGPSVKSIDDFYDAKIKQAEAGAVGKGVKDAFGTFSSAAAAAMSSGGGGGSPQERTAKYSERMAKGIDKLVDVLDDVLDLTDKQTKEIKKAFKFA